MRKYEQYINASAITEERIEMVKNITDAVLKQIEVLQSVSDCYDLSGFFKPVSTEEELVNQAIKGRNTNFLSSK